MTMSPHVSMQRDETRSCVEFFSLRGRRGSVVWLSCVCVLALWWCNSCVLALWGYNSTPPPTSATTVAQVSSTKSTMNVDKKAETSLHIVVILGAPVTAEATPGPDLQQRLDRCVEFWQQQQQTRDATTTTHESSLRIVVTGGNPQTYGSSGVMAEALVMQDYLLSKGVAGHDIWVEAQAIHTFHNALYTKQLLQDKKLGAKQPMSMTIVTHDWHMPRSLACFQIVWCNDPNVTFHAEPIPSDATDTRLQERITKEARFIKEWIPLCLKEEENSRCMPDIQAATTK